MVPTSATFSLSERVIKHDHVQVVNLDRRNYQKSMAIFNPAQVHFLEGDILMDHGRGISVWRGIFNWKKHVLNIFMCKKIENCNKIMAVISNHDYKMPLGQKCLIMK